MFKFSKLKYSQGFTLVEVTFVMLIVGVLILPILMQQNGLNQLSDFNLKNLESGDLSVEDLQSALGQPSQKTQLVTTLADLIMQQASMGHFVDHNLTAQGDILNAEYYLNNQATFFDAETKVYTLPTEEDATLALDTSHTYFVPVTVEGHSKFVPAFNYQWVFQDQSSNTLGGESNTSTGSYLIRAELQVFDVNSDVTPLSSANTAVASIDVDTPLDTFNTNANIRFNEDIEQMRSKAQEIPKTLLTFTFDLSKGACYSPATSQFSPRLIRRRKWTGLDLISVNTSTIEESNTKGLLCAPYFAPSLYNSSAPHSEGRVTETGLLKPSWYDIYHNNGVDKLFWTLDSTDTGEDKTDLYDSLPVTSLGRAIAAVGTTLNYFSMTALPTSPSTYRLLRPNLNLKSNNFYFPDGDFDYQALNKIRCANYDYNPKDMGILPNKWDKRYIWGLITPQNTSPFNSNVQACGGTSASSPSSFLAIQQGIGASYTFKPSGVNPPTPYNLNANKQMALEIARMPLLANYTGIGDATYGRLSTLDNDTIIEPQRWISGLEFQRSASLMAIFSLLNGGSDLREKLSVSTVLNSSNTNSSDPVVQPSSPAPLSTYQNTGTSFQTLMKHLYGINRRTSHAHLAKGNQYNLNASLEKYIFSLKATAKANCLETSTLTSTQCGGNKNIKKYDPYERYVNIIFLPSEMSADASILEPENTTSLNNGLNSMLNPSEIKDKLTTNTAKLFRKKQLYIFISHSSVHPLMKTKINALMNVLEAQQIAVEYYDVAGLAGYEALLKDTLLPRLTNLTVTPASEGNFYHTTPDQYTYDE
ncbi:MAG: prepilin-type N-terminal cleavage/methylation domain-containing protein [Vampirovibrio sp.]